MTPNQVAVELTVVDRGPKGLTIAQASAAVKAVRAMLKGPRALEVLKALLPMLILVLMTGCRNPSW